MNNLSRRFVGAASKLASCFGGAAAALALASNVAHAQKAEPWGFTLQPAATEVASDINWFNNFTLTIVTIIVLFVLALLIYVVVRFNKNANPVPSKVTHNTIIEVVWTIAPVLILLVIAIPSFRLLFKEVVIPKYDLTVKATGNQWYWNYTYPDSGNLKFDSYMLPEDKITDKVKQPRLLAVDYAMVVPVGKTVRIQTTATDVIHSFAVPSFGVKIDAIPGRLNESWFKVEKPGRYYGQCSELCGTNHAFMPIEVIAVPEADYQAWLATAAKDLDGAYKSLQVAVDAGEKGVKLASN